MRATAIRAGTLSECLPALAHECEGRARHREDCAGDRQDEEWRHAVAAAVRSSRLLSFRRGRQGHLGAGEHRPLDVAFSTRVDPKVFRQLCERALVAGDGVGPGDAAVTPIVEHC